ncbi:hypothetical protein E2C01_015717 [Portunus trituberculatus]|uniref:Uncharacterized protein n=1 Tax=Portunus trituberculatus TaxID=210409 RepID=A0A5B7DP50_PORTR|nr:hypothetical protein [Portunus trituberculatus]
MGRNEAKVGQWQKKKKRAHLVASSLGGPKELAERKGYKSNHRKNLYDLTSVRSHFPSRDGSNKFHTIPAAYFVSSLAVPPPVFCITPASSPRSPGRRSLTAQAHPVHGFNTGVRKLSPVTQCLTLRLLDAAHKFLSVAMLVRPEGIASPVNAGEDARDLTGMPEKRVVISSPVFMSHWIMKEVKTDKVIERRGNTNSKEF